MVLIDIIPYIAIANFLALIGFQIYYRYVSEEKLNALIKIHYKNIGIEVNEIIKLSLKEKLKYGVPSNSIFDLYSLIYSLFTMFGEHHVRKIETIDSHGNEQLRYIDAFVAKRKLKTLNEFESYSF